MDIQLDFKTEKQRVDSENNFLIEFKKVAPMKYTAKSKDLEHVTTSEFFILKSILGKLVVPCIFAPSSTSTSPLLSWTRENLRRWALIVQMILVMLIQT